MCPRKLRVVVAEGQSAEALEALQCLYREGDGPDSNESDGGGRFEFFTVNTMGTLLPMLAMVNPEIVILHVNLGGGDAAEVVRRVHRASPQTSILVFAPPERAEETRRCLNSGALNCLFKGHLQRELLDRLFQNALERKAVGTDTDLLRDQITGLYLREGLLTLGDQVLERARQTEGRAVLLCELLENWNALHAELGPATADNVVRDFAALLCSSFRRTDFVARIGSGQFAVLAVDASEPSAAVLRQRFDRRLAVFNSVRPEWERVRCRGNAEFWDAQDPRSFSALLDSCESGLCQPEMLLDCEDPPARVLR